MVCKSNADLFLFTILGILELHLQTFFFSVLLKTSKVKCFGEKVCPKNSLTVNKSHFPSDLLEA